MYRNLWNNSFNQRLCTRKFPLLPRICFYNRVQLVIYLRNVVQDPSYIIFFFLSLRPPWACLLHLYERFIMSIRNKIHDKKSHISPVSIYKNTRCPCVKLLLIKLLTLNITCMHVCFVYEMKWTHFALLSSWNKQKVLWNYVIFPSNLWLSYFFCIIT